MRHLFALALTLAACLLYGCTPWGQSMTPPVSQPTPCSDFCGGYSGPNATDMQHSGYVYVADGKAQALLVYPWGYSGVPLRAVGLDGAPFGVAADTDSGRVFVTEQLASEAQVFTRGAEHLVGQLTGVVSPDGVTVVDGKVYVANHATSSAPGFVGVYSSGTLKPLASYPAPTGYAVKDVAVDGTGNRFETIYNAASESVLVEYAPGASGGNFTLIAPLGRSALWGGLCLDAYGNVVVGELGALVTFEKPDFMVRRSTPAPGPGILTFFTHNNMGTFIPLNDGDGSSRVVVYPSNEAEKAFTLRLGMKTPLGATGGI